MTSTRRKSVVATLRRVAAFLNRLRAALAGGGASAAGRLRRAAPLVLLFVFLTLLLEYGGWMRSFETAALDTFLFLKEPLEAEHVVIVGITRDDYKEYFGERSPLDPERVRQIIDAIAKGRPAVIGVDIDTSAEAFRVLEPPPAPPPAVWARDAERVAPAQSDDRSFAAVTRGLLRHFLPFVFKPEEERFQVSGVLGRPSADVPSGVALLPRDTDSAIRRYRREFKAADKDAPPADSFSWAVVKEYARSTGRALETNEESEEGWVMNFAVAEETFRPISVKELMQVQDGAGWRGERGPVKDKIVLLGGVFPASRDRHYTPTGAKYGVELLAYAVESDLQGRTVKPPNKYAVWLAELLVGFALVLIHARFRERPKSLRYTVIAVPLLALLASFFVLSSLALWAFFLPVLLAVLVQQLYEDVQEFRKQRVRQLYEEAEGLGQDMRRVLTDLRAETDAQAVETNDGPPAADEEPRVEATPGGETSGGPSPKSEASEEAISTEETSKKDDAQSSVSPPTDAAAEPPTDGKVKPPTNAEAAEKV